MSSNRIVKLESLATFSNGRTSPERSDKGEYPVYGANGIIGYSNEYNSPEGTVVIGRVGSYCGAVYISNSNCWVTDNAIASLPKDGFDSLYLYFLLKRANLNNHKAGSGQPLLNQQILNNLQIQATTEPSAQKEIAKILGDLDRKIELNRRMNDTLEQIGQTLFKHYFIDNPECGNWDNRTLGEFFPIRTGKKDANFSTPNGQYPFFTCSQSTLKAPEYSFDGAALLLAGNGDFNIKYYRGKFEAYQRTYVLMPHNEKFLGLLYFLMSIYLGEITGGSRGSVIKFITKGMIEDYVVKLPEDDQLKEVSGQFNQLTIAIEKNRAQMQTLGIIRDGLLSKLLDGSIEV